MIVYNFYFNKLKNIKKILTIKFKVISIVLFLTINITSFPQTTVSGVVNASETHQTMDGFGASIAWYENTLTNHPLKDSIYYYIFENLGLDILRLRNVYRNSPTNFAPEFASIVQAMYNVSSERPKILISSWSPPANIKSNNNVNGGNNATLKKDSTGEYMYKEFGEYWVNALNAYKSVGIEPDYITLQNELSYDASWESCRFDPTENATVAGYDKALDSVYLALQNADLHPKILAPEVHGIGYNTFQNYAAAFNHDFADGYCYHLYHGGGGNANPDAFNTNLSAIANNYTDKPIWQTEYDVGNWMQTVWLMHNCLVNGNVSAYLWWELVWPSGSKPLVEMQSNNFLIYKYYWAFRQYSKFISAGWKRVGSQTDNSDLRMSAFINPDNNKLTLVILNIGTNTDTMNINIQNFNATNGIVVRTSDTENGVVINKNYDGTSAMEFPPNSITTLALSDSTISSYSGMFRSHQSGNWNDVNSWEKFDGYSWVYPSPYVPVIADKSIKIMEGDTITVTVSDSTDQLTVTSGGTLIINSGVTFNIKNGIGTDLTVNGTISNEGSLTIEGTLEVGDGSLSVESNWLLYGTNGTLKYSGSSAQTTGDVEFPSKDGPKNLIIANTRGVTLHATRSLEGNVDIAGGRLMLGENDLTAGTATNTGLTEFVRTDGQGELKLTSVGSESETLFPVGTNVFAPVWVSNIGTEDTIGVRVESDADAAPEGGRVRVKWIVSEAEEGGGDYTLKFGWRSPLEDTQFRQDRSANAGIFLLGSDTTEAGTGFYTKQFDEEPHTVSRGGITTLGSFAVGKFGDITASVEDKTVPLDFSLSQNYPNPFNPTTTITYTLRKTSKAKMIIYNILGVKVRTLVNRYQDAGEYSVVWDGLDDNNNAVSSGVYLYRLEAGDKSLQKKMILIR